MNLYDPQHGDENLTIPPLQNTAAIRAVVREIARIYPLHALVVANICAGNGTWGRVFAQERPNTALIALDEVGYAHHYYMDYDAYWPIDIRLDVYGAHLPPCNFVVGTVRRDTLAVYKAAIDAIWPFATHILLTDEAGDGNADADDRLVATPATAYWRIATTTYGAYIWTRDPRIQACTLPPGTYDASASFTRRVQALTRATRAGTVIHADVDRDTLLLKRH